MKETELTELKAKYEALKETKDKYEELADYWFDRAAELQKELAEATAVKLS